MATQYDGVPMFDALASLPHSTPPDITSLVNLMTTNQANSMATSNKTVAMPQQPTTPTMGPDANAPDAFAWMGAWLVLIIVLSFVNKTAIGHLVLYYTLVLAILFLVLLNAPTFSRMLAPFSYVSPTGATSGQGHAPSQEPVPANNPAGPRTQG